GERARVAEAGAQAAARAESVELALDKIGFFDRAGVIWVGPRVTPAALAALHREVRRQLQYQGQSFDGKRWHPHVTLFRKAQPPVRRILDRPLHWRVAELALLASQLSPNGPEYEVLARWPLGAEGRGLEADTAAGPGC
ncbi:MAG: 2'-5' RNA ligase family protein, partial [Halorhodospira sp.]